MSRRLRSTLTPTVHQDLAVHQGLALREALALAQCDLLAWRPLSATPQWQATFLAYQAPQLVTFCPTFQAFCAFQHLWHEQPAYTLEVVEQWRGYLCTLTRRLSEESLCIRPLQ